MVRRLKILLVLSIVFIFTISIALGTIVMMNEAAIVEQEQHDQVEYTDYKVAIFGYDEYVSRTSNGLSGYTSKIVNSTSYEDVGAIVVDNGTILIIDANWAEDQNKNELADTLKIVIEQGSPIITIGDMSDIINLTGYSMICTDASIITYGMKVFSDGGTACYLGGGSFDKNGQLESSIGSAYLWAIKWVSNEKPLGKYSLSPSRSVFDEAPNSVMTAPYWQFRYSYEYNTNDYYQPYGKFNVVNDYYQLVEDGTSTYDWYDGRVRLQTIPGKAAYGNSYVTMHTHNDFDADLHIGHYNDELNDYDPTTTYGVVTVGVTMGVNGGGVTSSMSWSYSITDVQVQDESDFAIELAKWKHEIENGSPPSKYTYTSQPGYCVRGANGSGFYMDEHYSVAFGKKNIWGDWQVYKDAEIHVWGPVY